MYYVNGNHDDCFPSILPSLAENCVHLNSIYPVHLNNVNLFGIDWQNTKEKVLEDLLNIYNSEEHNKHPERTVVIMHQSLQEFFAKDTQLCAKDIWDCLGKQVKVIIGDIHSNQCIETEEGGWILSPGPLVPQDIGQAKKEQYYHLLDTDLITFERVPVKVRDYIFLDLTSEKVNLSDKLQEISSTVPQTNLPSAVILSVKPNYVLPKDIPANLVVVSNVVFDRVDPSKKNTVELTLNDAVVAEIEATETANKDIMLSMYNTLKASNNPDETLMSIMEKWKIVMG